MAFVTPQTPCRGLRRPHVHPSRATGYCNTPQNGTVALRRCRGLHDWVNGPDNRQRCRGMICQTCQSSAENAQQLHETTIEDFRLKALCMKCQRKQATRYPLGQDCNCGKNLGRPARYNWKCHSCRRIAVDKMDRRSDQSDDWTFSLYRDRAGQVNFDRSLRTINRAIQRQQYVTCVGCAGLRPDKFDFAYNQITKWFYPRRNNLDMFENTASHCTTCNSIVVLPTVSNLDERNDLSLPEHCC